MERAKTWRQRILKIACVIVWLGVGCSVFYATPWGQQYSMTGHFFPIDRIDKLANPATVISWSEVGLNLLDRPSVMPAGMRKLPKDSALIMIATNHGVEVDPDGKVFCLLKIHHWCGNDPVRTDLKRIELSKLLAFYHEGQSDLKPHQYSESKFAKDFSEYGWNISRLSEMKMMFDPKFADLAIDDAQNQPAAPN